MPNVDWKWALIGLAIGLWGLPFVLAFLNSRRKSVTTAAS